MPTVQRNDVPAFIGTLQTVADPAQEVSKGVTVADLDLSLEHEVQTDKDAVKLVGCRECKRPLVVTTFFAPAKAICRECRGENAAINGTVASVGQPTPGKTNPADAVNLADCLVNKPFAVAVCPVHPDDESHVMELIQISHNDNYGPTQFMGWDKGRPVYRQLDVGEVVLHQCQACKATTTYSTTAQQLYRRMNEPRKQPDLGRRPGITLELLNGTRREED